MTTAKEAKKIIICTGGTGGHVLPALTLGDYLTDQGHRVHYIIDTRGERYFTKENAPQRAYTIVNSQPFKAGLKGKIALILPILRGIIQSLTIFLKTKPDTVVGFGGYMTVPPILTAALLRKPITLHEQNALLGMANRVLGRFARIIALSFETTQRIPQSLGDKTAVTGNPITSRFIRKAPPPYKAPSENAPLHLTIIGGSLGSKLFNETLPPLIAALPKALKARLRITQQCHTEDHDTVRSIYAKAEMPADSITLAPFFEDMTKVYAQSHLMIVRAGASTIAELAVTGRPAILIPLGASRDGDQAVNAADIVAHNAGWLVTENDLTTQLTPLLEKCLESPSNLQKASKNLLKLGYADAVETLAQSVLE